MKIYGVFGDPIEHSLSPVMQNAAFRALGMDACYLPFRVARERLKEAILGASAMGFGGLTLTSPLKEKALEIVQPDELAKAIGAVNTVSFGVSFGSEIRGHNTDGFGALLALENAGVKIRGRGRGTKVLLIGAGGAARAIAYTLEREGAEISIANRSLQRAEELAGMVGGMGHSLCDLEKLVKQSEVIINATSVGMKEGDSRLFPGGLLQSSHAVFDIVYNRETELLKDARAAGALALDGVMMLVYQGAKALEIWTGQKAPADVMEKAVREGLKKRAEKEKKAREAGKTREAGEMRAAREG
ncbi:MAG TPA: shikimate dehydrogenase [Methanotrichaceae archaeon]|nr:shikimate dehydrogenase [Methanotrichaceae archaeon]